MSTWLGQTAGRFAPFSLELAPGDAIMMQEETVRRAMSLTVLVLVGIGVQIASAQGTDPANPQVHAVIGVVTQVSVSSFGLRADNGERELKVDKLTSVSRVGTKRSPRNDGVWRETKLTDFVKVGDEALVTYSDDGVLTALKITVRPPARRTGR